MARNIWDVSDILLRQRAGDIYGGMFANLGQQVGAGIQQYGQNKQMAALGVADFEAAAKADPEILNSLQSEDVSKEVKSAFNRLKSGGVGVKDASVLSTYAKNFVTQKAQAIQQQADAMKLAEMQRLQQERVRMGELFGAMGQMEAQAVPQFYGTPAGAQTSTILDRPGMREQTARALASPTMQAARDLYQVMPSAVTPEALARFAEQEISALGKTRGGKPVEMTTESGVRVIYNPQTGVFSPVSERVAPQGFRYSKKDGQETLEAIPGGPEDIKQRQKTEARNEFVRQNTLIADNVIDTIDNALPMVDELTAGFPGKILSVIPGTKSKDLQNLITTIKANVSFDRLQQMREASPTGGALGQVAVEELRALQASIASLDQEQSPAQLRKNLEKVRKHYAAWRDAVQGKARPEETASGQSNLIKVDY